MRVVMTVIAVGLVAMWLPAGSVAQNCGRILDTDCPGCAPASPGGCGCKPLVLLRGASCMCGPSGNKIKCQCGYLDWESASPGRLISEAEPAICSIVKKCVTSSGSGDCPDDNPCISSNCSWKFDHATTTPSFTEGAACP